MHSSRMRTARLLTASHSIGEGGERLVCPGMGAGHLSMQWGRHPPVNRFTDRCKNITLSQTLFAGSKFQFSGVGGVERGERVFLRSQISELVFLAIWSKNVEA